jgi:hypothetical protein
LFVNEQAKACSTKHRSRLIDGAESLVTALAATESHGAEAKSRSVLFYKLLV